LLTGFCTGKWRFIRHGVPLEQAFALHNHPVRLPVPLHSLRALGFAPLVDGVSVKPKSVALSAVFVGSIKPSPGSTCSGAKKV
jgi:hypothetical protein